MTFFTEVCPHKAHLCFSFAAENITMMNAVPKSVQQSRK